MELEIKNAIIQHYSEYNLAQILTYRKVNSPEFTPNGQKFLQKLVWDIHWWVAVCPLPSLLKPVLAIHPLASAVNCCSLLALLTVCWKGAPFLVFPSVYTHSLVISTWNYVSVADIFDCYWTSFWNYERQLCCYTPAWEDSPLSLWEMGE